MLDIADASCYIVLMRANSHETTYALRLIEQGHTAYRAAKLAGIALSTIYRAIKRKKGTLGQKTSPK